VRIFAKMILVLTTVAVLAMVPEMTLAGANTSSGKHVKKHRMKISRGSEGSGRPWSAGQAWQVVKPSGLAGPACPGIARSFECRTWPPPFDEDPDRKASGADAGN
jgi:hypothetical protein